MVQISVPALLSLLVASAAAADLRAAHRGLHRRGQSPSVASYKTTFKMSSMVASNQPYPSEQPYPTKPAPSSEVDTTCTEESTPSYPESTPNKPYPQGSSPAGSTPAGSTPSYPQGSSPAGSVPAQSYPQGSSPAGASPTYPQGSSPSGAAPTYSESSPAAAVTSTTYETSYSTAYETVTGGGAAPSGASPSGSAPQECGTVTITVTAGQGSSYSAMGSSPAGSSPSAAATSYPAGSSPAAAATSSAVESSQAYPTQPSPVGNTYSKAAGAQNYQASAKPSPVSGGSPVGKRGMAYASIPSLNLGECNNVHWAHNWSPQSGNLPKGVEYVPMCKDTSMAEQFKTEAASASYLMSFNEVDMTKSGGGSAMSPEQAAASYKEIMMPFAGTHKLGAPSVTSHCAENDNLNGVSAASGLDYLKQFAQACEGCQIDFACVHWYGGGEDANTQAENFKTYMTQAISTIKGLWPNAKIWVDEFSATPTIEKDAGVNQQFMSAVLPWLDSQSDIERYSYFAATPGLMANPDGSLTEIGKTYAS